MALDIILCLSERESLREGYLNIANASEPISSFHAGVCDGAPYDSVVLEVSHMSPSYADESVIVGWWKAGN